MTADVVLRSARPDEAARLTAIAFAAKAHWGYPASQLDAWAPELTYTADVIRAHWVAVACRAPESDTIGTHSDVIGVCSLEPFGPYLEISGLWVDPPQMGQGIGRALTDHALRHGRECGVTTLRLLADPYAKAFYTALGALEVGLERGSPSGRLLPLMHFDLT
ncbi:MAG: GNAT family N-acetyltransferase [Pseudomonadota bacterium]